MNAHIPSSETVSICQWRKDYLVYPLNEALRSQHEGDEARYGTVKIFGPSSFIRAAFQRLVRHATDYCLLLAEQWSFIRRLTVAAGRFEGKNVTNTRGWGIAVPFTFFCLAPGPFWYNSIIISTLLCSSCLFYLARAMYINNSNDSNVKWNVRHNVGYFPTDIFIRNGTSSSKKMTQKSSVFKEYELGLWFCQCKESAYFIFSRTFFFLYDNAA